MKKFALGIEYDGTNYCGWQIQKKLPSIQYWIEFGLSKISNKNVRVFCAGRTDSGVHAINQVIHFCTGLKISKFSWIRGVNINIPRDISIKWILQVPKKFHACFSAKKRHYRYIIYNNISRTALFRNKVTHIPYFLNIKNMEYASKFLFGEHDFISFQSFQCQSLNSVKFIYNISIIKKNFFIIIDIEANSFLHKMVRNIVGTLIEIGANKKPRNWIEILFSKKVRYSGFCAPSNGLYLLNVYYPKKFKIPQSSVFFNSSI